jgi:glycerol kinase
MMRRSIIISPSLLRDYSVRQSVSYATGQSRTDQSRNLRVIVGRETMTYLLALDQGTTSSRAILFDDCGRQCALAQREFQQFYPQSGWVEHDADEIWQTQRDVAREVLAMHAIDAREIAAIGITSQRETVVLWERRSGRPLHRAIVWQDRRTAAVCDALKAQGHESMIRARTGLVVDPYFSATKLAWLLDQIPDARRRAAAGELAFGTVDSWLLWQLTGGCVHATDITNAARTQLFDIHRQAWSDELLALFDIPRVLLPDVRPSAFAFGVTDSAIFGNEIPIGGIAGDQQAALFGQACHAPGMAKNTYGTGCFMLMQTGARACESQHGLLTTSAAQIDAQPRYALEGSVFVAGAAVQWLRDGLGFIESAAEIEALAASVPDSGGVTLVPAFTGLGSPYWDAHARGALFGLTRGTTRAHIARATLEAIALQVADLLEAMQRDAQIQLTELRVDGGACANNLLMQMQADLLGVPVVRPRIIETTALGAAYLAGLTLGVWRGSEEITAQWQVEKIFAPQGSRAAAEQRLATWRDSVRRVLITP